MNSCCYSYTVLHCLLQSRILLKVIRHHSPQQCSTIYTSVGIIAVWSYVSYTMKEYIVLIYPFFSAFCIQQFYQYSNSHLCELLTPMLHGYIHYWQIFFPCACTAISPASLSWGFVSLLHELFSTLPPGAFFSLLCWGVCQGNRVTKQSPFAV